MGRRVPARRAALKRHRADEGNPGPQAGPRAAQRRGGRRTAVHRQHRGHRRDGERRRRGRNRWLLGQHRAEADRGRLQPDDESDPDGGDAVLARPSSAASCWRRRFVTCARRSTLRRPAAPTCWGSPARRRRPWPLHPARASRRRSRSRPAGVEQDVIARTQAALQEAGALHIRPHHRTEPAPRTQPRRRRRSQASRLPRPSRRLR